MKSNSLAWPDMALRPSITLASTKPCSAPMKASNSVSPPKPRNACVLKKLCANRKKWRLSVSLQEALPTTSTTYLGPLPVVSRWSNVGLLTASRVQNDTSKQGQDAVRRAATLTQPSSLSRVDGRSIKPTDVNKLVAGMEELVRRTVGPSIEVEVVGAGGLWLTRVDASQLESSLLNLCINARDAMMPGGEPPHDRDGKQMAR